MSIFTGTLIAHLSQKLNIDAADIEEALNSFSGAPVIEKKKIPPVEKATVLSKDNAKTGKSDENHTCERIKKGKNEPCGKNATRHLVVDGEKHYYCGTPSSGCYTIQVKGQISKETSNPSKEKPSKEKSKKSDASPVSLIDRIIQQKKLDCVPKKLSNGETVYMEKKTRALFDRDTQECYGVLDEDGETILPVDSKTAKWVESENLTIKSNTIIQKHKNRTVEPLIDDQLGEELALSEESS